MDSSNEEKIFSLLCRIQLRMSTIDKSIAATDQLFSMFYIEAFIRKILRTYQTRQ